MAELVECARLEIAYTGDRIGGSNPSISAIDRHAIYCVYFYFCEILGSNQRAGVRTVAKRRNNTGLPAGQILQGGEATPPSPPEIDRHAICCVLKFI